MVKVFLRQLDAVQAGHTDIRHQDIRLEYAYHVQCPLAVIADFQLVNPDLLPVDL